MWKKLYNLSAQNELNELRMVQFECPRHWKNTVSFTFRVGWIPFYHYWPSGIIRIGLPVWNSKSCKIFRTKGVKWDANGPVWMPQALKTLCLILFLVWKNSLCWLLVLWGNKNWPPSMKVKKLEIFFGLNWLDRLQMVQFECHRH